MARIPSGMRKKENGLFEKRFTVDGKRYSAYGHNVKECAENEARIREEIKAGLYNSNKNITLDAYFEEWEKSRIGVIKDSSLKINRSKYNNHIKPVLGKTKIQKIEKREVVKLQQDLSKKLSASMTNGVIVVLKTVLNAAIDDEIGESMIYPVAHRLITKCDAIYRIKGASKGADMDIDVAHKHGLTVYFRLEDIPLA